MSPPPKDDDLFSDLDGAERARLDRVRRTLLEVGAPPELPPTLHDPPEPRAASPLGRYRFTAIATAVVVGAALFATGYVLGGGETPEQTVSATPLAGAAGATGEVVVLEREAGGNWPVELTVRGLPELPADQDYELRVATRSRAGSTPSWVPVGRFRTAAGRSVTVRLSTPADVGRGGAEWSVGPTSRPGESLLRSTG